MSETRYCDEMAHGRPLCPVQCDACATPARAEGVDDGPFFEDTEDAARKWLTDDRVLTAPEISRLCRALLDYSTRLRLQAVARIEARIASRATPAPEVTVSEAMVEAAVEYELSTYPADVAERMRRSGVIDKARDFYRAILTAALRAATPEVPRE